MDRTRRVVLALAASQALFQTASVLLMTVGGLAGLMLAPSRGLATLPIAAIALGTAAATIPASLLMGRIGRKPGFIAGAVFGAAGGGLAALAMAVGSFPLLCAGTMLVGVYQGFAQFYRFAAAEASPAEFRSRAISYVLAGGIVAAVAGPHLGAWAKDLAPAGAYTGSFLVILMLSLAAVGLLAATPIDGAQPAESEAAQARALAVIARQPKFLVAVAGAAIGYGVMVTVMTATPLSMTGHQHGVHDAASVIQWHVLGMFVPSFFTGWLIRRSGVTPLMLTGTLLLLGHVAVALSGIAFLHYLSALVLLGVGWNFLYVGGSTLLTETYLPAERAKVQALNDFLIVGVVAAGSFSAGALYDQAGWRGLNLAVAPVLLALALALAGIMVRARSPAVRAGAGG